MSTTLHDVPAGCPLTPCEWRAVLGLGRGQTYQQIAAEHGVAATTVRHQLHTGYARLGVANAAQCVAVVIGAGWLDPPPTEWEDRRVSAAQAAYLQAFDRYLASGAPTDRAAMRVMVPLLRYERGLAPAQQRGGRPDALDELAAAILAPTGP